MAKKNLINADMLLATPRRVEIPAQTPPQYLNETQSFETQNIELRNIPPNFGTESGQTDLKLENTEGGQIDSQLTIHNSQLQKAAERMITSVQRGLKIGETRATFIVQEDALEKIKAIAYWDRQNIKDVVQTVFEAYIAQYESKNGVIQPIP